MSTSDLVKIVIAAFIGAIAREVVTFVLRHSKTASKKLLSAIGPVLRRHWRVLAMLYYVLLMFFCARFVWIAFNDNSPATRKFAATCVVVSLLFVDSNRHLLIHSAKYGDALRAERAKV